MAAKGAKAKVKKVVLAYSGGLDTSIILKWLQETYRAEVVTFTADLGQGEELAPARKKAELLGIKKDNIFVEDLREEFIADYVFPMFRANALYEGVYLLGTSIARPLIAKKQIEIARKTGADAVCHGATGKGNDQVRFELTYYALEPSIKIIAPWREWAFKSREELIAFAEAHQIPVAKDKRGEAPFSVDANMLHSSSEGKVLEDPAIEPPPYVYQRTISPMEAPDKATDVTIGFAKGDAVSLDGRKLSPATLFAKLNELGRDNGIGRVDLVENRFVGMKSRGVYETPGGTMLMVAHRAIESITLDRGASHLKDELMPRYAELIYNGFWFAPERLMLQAAIDKSQEHVEGTVRLKLYKGNVIVTGRQSDKSLYSTSLVTFEDDKGAYDQKDAEGFIRLNALRLRTLAMRDKGGELSTPMFNRLELGRIAGIEIYLDMMFVLVLLIFTYPYFTSGNMQAMSAGFIIVIGLILSILLHELGHAFAGRLFNARVSHIDLTGIGGVAHFERSLPASVLARTVIYLAGPAVNLGLWLGLGALVGDAAGLGRPMLALPLAVLASANFFLMCFNLLPAYPLDGGHTLDAWLGAILGPVWSVRIVAGLGLVVAVGLAIYALPSGIFMLFVALFLGQANWEAWQSVSHNRWR